MFVCLLMVSCGQTESKIQSESDDVPEEQMKNTFHSAEIGWTIEIPEGWKLVDEKSIRANNQKGMDAIEQTAGKEFDASGLQQLVSFQKDEVNMFQSSIEPFAEDSPGEWKANNAALKHLVYQTYKDQGLTADTSATKIESVDGIDFEVYSFQIIGNDGVVLLSQVMYSCLLNACDFGVILNYNNDSDRDQLMKAWRNSKFTKN
ncbi:MAG: DUF4142 domain-containing protein [Bacteroidetes bacterium]|nr:DUF4142 domain-containing protein [Bacteroidota bacterium]